MPHTQVLFHKCNNSGYGLVFQSKLIYVHICTVHVHTSKRTWNSLDCCDCECLLVLFNSRITCCICVFSAVLSEVVSMCNSERLCILRY